MPNGDPRDGFVYPTLTLMMDSYIIFHVFSIVTFEDKRKQNFDKGQAELEKRRQMLQDQMRREEEARQEKERKEHEKRERQR